MKTTLFWRSTILWSAMACVLLAVQSFGSQAVLANRAVAQENCHVLFVYDGDTLGCDLNQNGKLDAASERVRLLGIDAPEASYSPKNHTGKDEPFSQEAKASLQQWVNLQPQHRVLLRYGRKRYDRYKRPLAYVFAVGSAQEAQSVNEWLLLKGEARRFVMQAQYGFDAVMEKRLQHALKQAQQLKVGLWKR